MASIDYTIKEVEKVVNFDGDIKDVKVSRLTAPGENFLSLVLRVDFEVENREDKQSNIIHSVAKCLPLNSKKEGDFDFHGHAMKNEIKWYAEILPLLKDFAKEQGLETKFYPKYYGSRLSLDPSKQEADRDAVLLLENLIPQGYKNDDRYIGCDFNTSRAILKSLAFFHAVPIAIKVKKPELFQTLKDFLEKTHPKPPKNKQHGSDEGKTPFDPPPGKLGHEKVLCEELAKIQKFTPYRSKIIPFLQNQKMGPDMFNKITKEPWNTIAHSDFWVNNVMTNTNEEEPLVKIVDFQMCSYGSYAKDLVFFLLSSVRNDVTENSMDELLRLYYDEFTSALQRLDTNLELTYEDYLEEIRNTAQESELQHALSFSPTIFGEKGTGIDAAVEEFDPFDHMTSMLRNMNQQNKEKLCLIASEAIKRDWIKSY